MDEAAPALLQRAGRHVPRREPHTPSGVPARLSTAAPGAHEGRKVEGPAARSRGTMMDHRTRLIAIPAEVRGQILDVIGHEAAERGLDRDGTENQLGRELDELAEALLDTP